jgi:hypothetical protein
MDHWRRWRSRRPAGRAGARRAGVTALALFAVTTTLAVLLAVLSHLGVAAIGVTILGGVPTLYLAWAAMPGAISSPEAGAARKPAYGRLVERWDPVKELGVHPVIRGGPLPPYVRRQHDELLRAVLDPAVAANRLVVVRGESSTGKSRAAYEAVAGRLADWQLDYPLDAGALEARLKAGIPPGTVLWLGELRQYADGGPAVLGHLADLLHGEGLLVITTVWPEQWATYTEAARAGPGPADPAGTAGQLLKRLPELTGRDPAGIDPACGGVIDVPDRFATADLEAAARAGDPLLAEAAAAAAGAGQGGRVTQYLAGVLDLLDRYGGLGGDPYGQAVITAAMDATRLGHASPLPAALIQDAAVGYLTGRQRTKDIASWRDTALAWATAELNGAVRAVEPVPPAEGTGVVGYQIADYLDQHGRRTRHEQRGPASLWNALTAHTAAARDLVRLGRAAQDRGLFRRAAALWTTAVTLGELQGAARLITLLRQVSPGDTTRAARWAADYVDLEWYYLLRLMPGEPDLHIELLYPKSLRLARAHAQRPVRDDLRDPLNPPNRMIRKQMLLIYGMAGPSDAARARAPGLAEGTSLEDPGLVAVLLGALRAVGASNAVTTLLARDPVRHASLDDPGALAALLGALRAAGVSDSVTALASRAANAGRVDLFLEVCPDEASSYRFGCEPDGSPSPAWKWQEPASENRVCELDRWMLSTFRRLITRAPVLRVIVVVQAARKNFICLGSPLVTRWRTAGRNDCRSRQGLHAPLQQHRLTGGVAALPYWRTRSRLVPVTT